MPWMETSPMDERARFIAAHRDGRYDMTELCERYGISRKTGYKWLARFEAAGHAGLQDRSRAPHSCPHRISAEVADRLCALRRTHPDWGPKKLLTRLARRYPAIAWPAVSTAGDLLAREGLVTRRRRRRPHPHPGATPLQTQAPNDVWTTDFKGEFRTRDGRWCYPHTIADLHTRFLLGCHGLAAPNTTGARQVFERVFRTYGLPRAIRSDNGAPFASTGLHGLSQLSVWWMRLGIVHHRIRPRAPQENGAHERMHRTLKAATLRPPSATMAAQQRAFDAFRRLYNDERPHEALHGDTPGMHYGASPRVYPVRIPPIEYPGHFLIRRVGVDGNFRFRGRALFLTKTLSHLPVGLEEVDDGLWSIYFGAVLIARLDEHDWSIAD